MKPANERSPHLVRPVFLAGFIITFALAIVIGWLFPATTGSRKSKAALILSNLKRIDLAKHIWAEDHNATNGMTVSELDLENYFGNTRNSKGRVELIDGETYRLNAIGAPPEAQLAKPMGKWPEGTLIVLKTNGGFRVVLPNRQKSSNKNHSP